jgi:cytoplasmic iron level regulating protein YaaA (DUF328/UPF0246 family)
MAYIISCSGRKRCPLQNPNSQPSTIENLSFNDELFICRLQNIENQNVILNWEFCLPAWQLYSGRIYSPIIADNWVKNETNVLIVSALFGIIKHTDLIPSYKLVMNNNIANYWRNNIDLNNFINQKVDIDLLSKNYKKAFNPQGNRIAEVPNAIFADKYGHHKGIWLNNQLNNL